MDSSMKTAGDMLNMKIILAALWVARMLSGIQADTVRLNDPDGLKALIEKTGPVVATPELLLVMSVIFAVPILMIILTLTLKYPMIRWANRIIGTFFASFDLVFLVLALFVWRSAGYEVVWSVVYLVLTTLVVWYAWKLPEQEA